MSKNKTYTITLNEQQAGVLNGLLNLGVRKLAEDDYDITQEDLKVAQELVHELSEKYHKNGWCKDPDCKAV